jgi:hypothetical protein
MLPLSFPTPAPRIPAPIRASTPSPKTNPWLHSFGIFPKSASSMVLKTPAGVAEFPKNQAIKQLTRKEDLPTLMATLGSHGAGRASRVRAVAEVLSNQVTRIPCFARGSFNRRDLHAAFA